MALKAMLSFEWKCRIGFSLVGPAKPLQDTEFAKKEEKAAKSLLNTFAIFLRLQKKKKKQH
jgi:hypothetical protein